MRATDMNNYDEIFDKLHYIIEGKDFTLRPDSVIQQLPFKEFLETFICAQLSALTKWKKISENKENINKIFFDFDKNKIKEHDGECFNSELKKIKCGSLVRKAQMAALNENIKTLEKATQEWKNIGNYITKNPIDKVIPSFASSKGAYKLKQMGVPLVCEWLKHYVDLVKPDVHVKRILGPERLSLLSGKERKCQVIEKIKNLKSKYSLREIDLMLWEYCRKDGDYETCCAEPKCNKCCICKISEYCNLYKTNKNKI